MLDEKLYDGSSKGLSHFLRKLSSHANDAGWGHINKTKGYDIKKMFCSLCNKQGRTLRHFSSLMRQVTEQSPCTNFMVNDDQFNEFLFSRVLKQGVQ